MTPPSPRVETMIDGRRLVLSNLDKVLYPAAAFTKAEVIDYYVRIAPTMLAHVGDLFDAEGDGRALGVVERRRGQRAVGGAEVDADGEARVSHGGS